MIRVSTSYLIISFKSYDRFQINFILYVRLLSKLFNIISFQTHKFVLYQGTFNSMGWAVGSSFNILYCRIIINKITSNIQNSEHPNVKNSALSRTWMWFTRSLMAGISTRGSILIWRNKSAVLYIYHNLTWLDIIFTSMKVYCYLNTNWWALVVSCSSTAIPTSC